MPQTADAELWNADELNGAVAVVKRGACPFHEKARRVMNAGAIACVIVLNEGDVLLGPADPEKKAADIGIPVVAVLASVGTKLVDGFEVKREFCAPWN